MNIQDCLPLMTKRHLSRIVDSIVKENLPKGDEDRLREQIRQNAKELANVGRLESALDLTGQGRDQRILCVAILQELLESMSRAERPETVFELVCEGHKALVAAASSDDAFTFTDPKSLDIYQTVLEVALEDGEVTSDEFALLTRLRQKLGISRYEHRLLEARLGVFPKAGNALHSFDEFNDAVRTLESRGLLFFCNRAEGGAALALPEELWAGVGAALGFEMRVGAQEMLHDALTTVQLRAALAAQGLPLSGSKQERSARLLQAGVRPSEVLDVLSNDERADLCRRLPGVKVAGSKQARLERIVEYFASLTTKDVEDTADPRAERYAYLEEFAARDSQNLYQRALIKNDRDIDAGFEDGTRYLFEVKLGQALIPMEGSEHADGCVSFPNGELLLWDNKSTGHDYVMPISHMDQFRRYIRTAPSRVNVFVVVVPSVADGVRLQAMKLRHQTGSDTDIAVVTAEDLKFVAENWDKHAKGKPFDLEVLNATGVLDRSTLEERMHVLLG